jgi:hypothetical protein
MKKHRYKTGIEFPANPRIPQGLGEIKQQQGKKEFL